ncbi:MAG: M3 family oligoendopeptidase [Methanomassiliicoccales archaeon]|nr:MAG: M3 family oligoendopeptidase [Methanomassiliicoccales archaeon]
MSEMKWDLSQLVEDEEPEKIIMKLQEMVTDSKAFSEKYHGKIGKLSPKGLKKMLDEKDALFLKYEGVVKYCHLRYTADTSDPVSNRLYAAQSKSSTESGQHLAFLDIELGKRLVKDPKLIDSPELVEYKHYLERQAKAAPHVLSEDEEKIILMKDQNGINAWSKLQKSWLSTRTFKMKVDGTEKDLSFGEVLNYANDPAREVRRAAHDSVNSVLSANDTIWTEALNSICSDHLQMSRLRKYSSPIESSLIFNDVEEVAIKEMMSVVERNIEFGKRYYATKAKLLGIPKISDCDILAPVSLSQKKYTWEESREIVTEAYERFDASWGRWINRMFDERHIDGEVRKGKVAGAFCDDWVSKKSAYILMSFNGNLHDVFTQAHELGHSVHAYLYTQRQNPSNCLISYCIAECGSIFGELLLTDHMLQKATNDEERKAVLASVLDTFTYILFHVGARYAFEQSIYDAIEKGKSLDAKSVCRLWEEARGRFMSDSVEWSPGSSWIWARVPHYFMTYLRFYNYPYIFAQLFVFSLYRLYKEQGEDFVPKMNELLMSGSSLSVSELGKKLGFDLETEEFWEKGIEQAKEFLSQLERYC